VPSVVDVVEIGSPVEVVMETVVELVEAVVPPSEMMVLPEPLGRPVVAGTAEDVQVDQNDVQKALMDCPDAAVNQVLNPASPSL
jgi:hypothetical protein